MTFFCLQPCLAAEHAYISNQGSNNVSVIELGKNRVIATIPVGKAPVGVAVSSKLKRVYISNVDSQSISVIDSANNTVIEELALKGSPVGLALAPDGSVL